MIMKMSSACNSSICIWLGTDHLTFKGGGGIMAFFSFRICFSDNTRVRIFFFVAQSAKFFPVFNIRLYDKNSESAIHEKFVC